MRNILERKKCNKNEVGCRKCFDTVHRMQLEKWEGEAELKKNVWNPTNIAIAARVAVSQEMVVPGRRGY